MSGHARFRRLMVLVMLVGGAFTLSVGAPDATGEPHIGRHSSGVRLLDRSWSDPYVNASSPVRQAKDEAIEFAENHSDVGYPYIVVSPLSYQVLARIPQPRRLLNGSAEMALTAKVTSGEMSLLELDAIADEVIGEQPEGITVVTSHPASTEGFVVLEVDAIDDRFVNRVAQQYGPESIAVKVADYGILEPNRDRQNDISPFWGGSKLPGCTNGLPWTNQAMVTAGHCYPNGASYVTMPGYGDLGRVNRSSRENWNPGVGTVRLTGQDILRGDVSLIEYDASGIWAGRKIYRGGKNSGTGSAIWGKANNLPSAGDTYCTSGKMTGEICGLTVAWNAVGSVTYDSGDILRKVWFGTGTGHCHIQGDSGSPVYRVRPGGWLAVVGVHSGGNSTDQNCAEFFTDVDRIDAAFPGTLRTW